MKQEVKTETPEEELPEKEDKPVATPGAEASSQTEVYNAEKPSLSPGNIPLFHTLACNYLKKDCMKSI